MVYDQTSLSGGTVKLENRVGGGARVTLRLPYRKGAKSPRTGLVLLVEDNEDIRTTVREMLRAIGHSVLEAASADEAEALIALPGLDLVLTDITLPGRLTGVDLAERIATAGAGPAVGLMTSLPPANPLRARAAARFPVLAKPFDATMLATFLTSVRP
jgi:CheY-like chemotaxis protein